MDKVWLSQYESGVPDTQSYPEQPLTAFLDRAVERYPNRPSMYFFDERISYHTLGSYVNRFANALIGLGVKPGDRVAVHLPNSPQFVIAYYGALRAGAVVAAHSPLYTESELEHQLNDCGAETIVTLTLTYARVKEAQPRTKVRNVIVANIKDFFPPYLQVLFTLFREEKEGHRAHIEPGDHAFMPLVLAAPESLPSVEVKADDLALLQYTGGTTGLPKAAMLTHRALVTNVLQMAHWNPKAEVGREVFLCVLPFFHLYGQQVSMNHAIYLASALILFPRYERKPTLRAIDRYGPTIFPGVATLYINLMEDPELGKHNLHSIHSFLSGAMALPLEVQQHFEQISGGRMVEGYGMTETGPVTHSNPVHGARKIGSVGVPVTDTDAKIVNIEDGVSEMKVGEAGEICVRGPQLMQGYWNQPEETSHVIREGWLHTGDIGMVDSDGFFFIVDRMKDMIISGGYKIFPRDVEEVLYTHPKIKEAALVGIKDAYHGELPKAFIVLRDGQTASADEIIAFCREKLASYKVPKAVEFRSELPKSLVGKILKRKLVEESAPKPAQACQP